jgi:MFS family permease
VTLTRGFDPAAGGLLSALIALADIPGSLLGGYCADRSANLRMFVVGPLIVVAALLALIPVASAGALWVLGIGIGFFLIFGFSSSRSSSATSCPDQFRRRPGISRRRLVRVRPDRAGRAQPGRGREPPRRGHASSGPALI